MKFELREDFTWSLVVPTSIGIRITPLSGQPVHASDTYHMQVTSAETNVASVSSYLGLPVHSQPKSGSIPYPFGPANRKSRDGWY